MVPEARRPVPDSESSSPVASGRREPGKAEAASRRRDQNQLIDIERSKRYPSGQGHLFGGMGMKVLLSPAEQKRAWQWLADVNEDLELARYPTRVELWRAVDEAARRAESLARLEYALRGLPLR